MVAGNGRRIRSVRAREILDSRGNPTVEAEVLTEGGAFGRAAVPSGASTGAYEAVELRDGDPGRFGGKGVLKAVSAINGKLGPALVGFDVTDQEGIDRFLAERDGTDQKKVLGGNTTLAVSLAAAKAAAAALGKPVYKHLGGAGASKLPVPLMNVINGGKHAGTKLAFQEFMIIPAGFGRFEDALRAGAEVYQALKDLLRRKYGPSSINVGDEGGFAPNLPDVRSALDNLAGAVEAAGYDAKRQVMLGLDCASSSIYEDGKYLVDGKWVGSGELMEMLLGLVEDYKLLSIEDPFEEEDFESFAEITRKVGGKAQVVGDDIFVTNVKRLSKGISMGAANALLLKVNQIGTLSEALGAAKLAADNGYGVVVSHRSGETEDPVIADIAVGIGSGQIKTGAPARGERTAKYNQLLRISEELGGDARFPGLGAFLRR
ncbi:MAG: phosphopyruvate hydratase [Candidatus Brockarchaeota archaeon]|nr:phosphopyruvate hydratase [Candidatus Brockarchaeota archaeon]